MQDRYPQLDESSCYARPDHTFGSKADVTLLDFDVRFTPKSRHGPTHFMSTRLKGSGQVVTRKQVNRWGRGGIWETGGRPMERDSVL
jgi:hypothetical protein